MKVEKDDIENKKNENLNNRFVFFIYVLTFIFSNLKV